MRPQRAPPTIMKTRTNVLSFFNPRRISWINPRAPCPTPLPATATSMKHDSDCYLALLHPLLSRPEAEELLDRERRKRTPFEHSPIWHLKNEKTDAQRIEDSPIRQYKNGTA